MQASAHWRALEPIDCGIVCYVICAVLGIAVMLARLQQLHCRQLQASDRIA